MTNQQVIDFANKKVRVYADARAQSLATAHALVDFWNANPALAAATPNDASVVNDGAATDGRTILTGAALTNIVTRALEEIADMEVPTTAKKNTILAVAVNGGSRF